MTTTTPPLPLDVPLDHAPPASRDARRHPSRAAAADLTRHTALGRFLHPTSLLDAVRTLPGAAAGATVFGLCASLTTPRPAALVDALALPAVPLVFLAGFVPSTWVLLTLLDGRHALATVLRAGLEATAVYGVALLGLAPAVAFLELTSERAAAAGMLTALVSLAALTAWGLGLARYASVLGACDDDVETPAASRAVVAFVVGLGLLVFRHTALPAIVRLHEVVS